MTRQPIAHKVQREGLEQKRKGLYTIGWQVPMLAERWLAANDWARMRHQLPLEKPAQVARLAIDGFNRH